MAPTDPGPRSQRRFPRALLWLGAAVALFRIATIVADRRAGVDHGAGLVAWTPGESVTALAAKERKPVLYDFTAAWCPPCKRLDAEAWADPATARQVRESFAPARIVDRQREDGSNPAWVDELHRRYSIRAFPTLVVADASGNEIAKMEGYVDRKSFEEFLAGALQKAGQR